MRMIEGIVEDPTDERLAELEAENRELRAELSAARAEATRARQESGRALVGLRRQLAPLYRALKDVFGELDAAGVDDTAAPIASNSRTAAIWESWKARLPGGPAKIIDALLLQPDMNTQQLAIATGVHRNSIPTMIYKLNKAGLLNKNGHRFSLKAL